MAFLRSFAGPAVVIALAVAAWTYRDRLFPRSVPIAEASTESATESVEKQTVLEISEQARKTCR